MKNLKRLWSLLTFAMILITFLNCNMGNNTSSTPSYSPFPSSSYTGRAFYVSSEGDDSNDGRSTSSAWKTIEKVNDQTFSPGDAIFFRAGDTFRDTLVIGNSGTASEYIHYSRYGNGENPLFLGSDQAASWTVTSNPRVWESLENFNDIHIDEYYAAEIFLVEHDGSITWGESQDYDSGFSQLTQEYQWTWNDNKIFLYSSENPETGYTSVEVPQRTSCIQLNNPQESSIDYIELNGLDMRFGKNKGFLAGYPARPGARGQIFRNLRVDYIGEKGGSNSYGLAVWHSDLLIENCLFSDCGRRAISLNLYLDTYDRHITNVVIRNNDFRRGYHTTSLDLSCQPTSGDIIEDVYFYNNLIDDSEVLMSGKDETSNQIFIQQGNSTIDKIYIYNNIFVEATARNILLEGGDRYYIWNNTVLGHNPNITTNPYGNIGLGDAARVDIRNNILFDSLGDTSQENNIVHGYNSETQYIHRDYNLYYSLYPKRDRNFTSIYADGYNRYYDTGDWQDFLEDFPTMEQNSPLPQEPGLVNYSSFRLRSDSPARGAGTVISGFTLPEPMTDYYGNEMNNPPDLGAVQYGS